MLIKKLIKEIEDHTGQNFDPKKRMHLLHLNEKIKRLNQDKLRKLGLIEQVIKSENGEDQIYNHTSHYISKRRD